MNKNDIDNIIDLRTDKILNVFLFNNKAYQKLKRFALIKYNTFLYDYNTYLYEDALDFDKRTFLE